ncbi:MAG: acyltransferase family protein [Burkholderiaceae bacterium]
MSLALIDRQTSFPGWAAVAPALATAALLLGGSGAGASGPARLLAIKPMTWIGQRSYSIYLWHWPAIVFAKVLWPVGSISAPIAALAVTFVGASVSYVWVEQPVRRSRLLANSRHRSIALAGCMTLASATIAIVAVASFMHFSRQPSQLAIAEAIDTYPVASGSTHKCLVLFADAGLTECAFGRTIHPQKTIVLFGDSHADHWSTPLVDIADKRGWRVITLLKAFCPAIASDVYVERLHRVSSECVQWRSSAMERIAGLHPDLVVIGEASSAYVTSKWNVGDRHAVASEDWATAMAATVNTLTAAGIPVLIMRDTPRADESSAVCLARVVWRGGDPGRCALVRTAAIDDRVANAERAAAASARTASYQDWTDAFCDRERCPAVIDGVIVYRDSNHISDAFASHLAPALEQAIDRAMAKVSK